MFCDEAFHGNEGRVEVWIKAHESSIGECRVDGLGQLADVFAMIEEAEAFTIGHDADGIECHTCNLPRQIDYLSGTLLQSLHEEARTFRHSGLIRKDRSHAVHGTEPLA